MEGVTIEVFRAGEHLAMSGYKFAFTRQDVQDIADAFDPEKGPVPVVVGHPKTDGPAYAWVEAVFVEGDVLKAVLKDVDPKFAEIVKAGRYKRISAAFFQPKAPNSPVPEGYYLRHIGFLGAVAPAVKGLKPVEFSDSSNDWLAFGGMHPAQLAANYQSALRLIQNDRDVERPVDQGKVLPCGRAEVLAFMAGLDKSVEVAFCDGGEKQTMCDWFKGYLERMPEIVPMGRVVNPQGDDLETVQFGAPDGYKVDRGGLDLHAKATHIMREKGIRFEDALEFVHGD